MSTQGMLAAIARKRAGGAPPGFLLIYSGGSVDPAGWTASPNTLFYQGHDVYADPATTSLELSDTGDIDGDLNVSVLTGLITSNLHNNPLNSFDSHGLASMTGNGSVNAKSVNITGCSALTVIVVQNVTASTVLLTGCTGALTIVQVANCPGVTSMDFSPCVNSNGDVFATDCPLLASVTLPNLPSALFILTGNAFTEAAVDAVLAFLVSINFTGTVNLSGGTSTPPSAAGLADKATLEGNGATVTVNGASAPTLIAHAGTNTGASGANSCVTNAINSTGANLIVVNVGWFIGVSSSGTLSDSTGMNTWVPLTPSPVGVMRSQLFYCFNPVTNAAQTFTFTASTSFASIEVQAWSNIAASPFDQENGASGTSASTIQAGSITPSQANTVVIVGLGHENGGGVPTIDGGFTISDLQAYNGSQEGSGMGYLILSAVAAQNPTWTLAGSTDVAATIASFKY